MTKVSGLMSFSEIGAELGISEGQSYYIYKNAMLKVAKILISEGISLDDFFNVFESSCTDALLKEIDKLHDAEDQLDNQD